MGINISYGMQGEENRDDSETQNTNRPYSMNNPQRIDLEDLEKLTLEDYGLDAQSVKGCMFGFEILDPRTGEAPDDSFYTQVVEQSLAQAEQIFDIAIFPRVVEERHDFHTQHAKSYMYTHTYKRPILQVEDLSIKLAGTELRRYASRYWNVYSLSGHIEIMPTAIQSYTDSFYYGSPLMNFPMSTGRYDYGNTFAPQLVQVKYIAGLLPRQKGTYNSDWEIPANLEKYILLLAAKEIIKTYWRLLTPVGIQSTHLMVDGISETVQTTASATKAVYSAEVMQIDSELKVLENALKKYFGDSSMISV